MNRRHFMQSILAAGVAPWVVTTAGVLMPVRKIVESAVAKWKHVVVGYGPHEVVLPASYIGKQYIIKNEGKGVLRIYPGPIIIAPDETRMFTI